MRIKRREINPFKNERVLLNPIPNFLEKFSPYFTGFFLCLLRFWCIIYFVLVKGIHPEGKYELSNVRMQNWQVTCLIFVD